MGYISETDTDKKIIILIEDVDKLALHALTYAKEISKDIVVFSAITAQYKEEELRAKWDSINSDIPYIIKHSQYKAAGTLLCELIDSSEDDKDVAVLVPLAVMKSWWQKYLNRSYLKQLKRSLKQKNNIVIVEVPYYLDKAA